MIAPNVKQYNGVAETTTTHEGIFDKKGKRVIDNKTNLPKAIPDPQWLLFEKCMRGDPTDNVFSAYPKIRKNKLQEAFEDRATKGFAWNNLMLQRWVDHNGEEHRVLDDYLRNVVIVDLSAQPDDVKVNIATTIAENSIPKSIPQIGTKFLKFCGKYDLKRISDNIQNFVDFLSAPYPEKT